MKRLCTLLMTIVLVLTSSVCFTISACASFNDVYVGHWAYDAIHFAAEAELLNGYSDGSFKPNNTITRAEAMKVLVLFTKRNPEFVEQTFGDVRSGDWFAPYVEAGKDLFPSSSLGVNFRPNDPMTRGDAIFALVRILGFTSAVSFVDVRNLDEFTDANQINAEILPYVSIALQTSLISGYSDSTIRTNGELTRAEFVAMLYRTYKMREARISGDSAESVTQKIVTPQDDLSLSSVAVSGSFANETVYHVNKIRQDNGYDELIMNPVLCDLAQMKAEDMRDNNYFSHTSPTLGTATTLLKERNLLKRNMVVGENIVKNIDSPEKVVDNWMDSVMYRSNITSIKFKEVGVGYVPEENIVVLIFISND